MYLTLVSSRHFQGAGLSLYRLRAVVCLGCFDVFLPFFLFLSFLLCFFACGSFSLWLARIHSSFRIFPFSTRLLCCVCELCVCVCNCASVCGDGSDEHGRWDISFYRSNLFWSLNVYFSSLPFIFYFFPFLPSYCLFRLCHVNYYSIALVQRTHAPHSTSRRSLCLWPIPFYYLGESTICSRHRKCYSSRPEGGTGRCPHRRSRASMRPSILPYCIQCNPSISHASSRDRYGGQTRVREAGRAAVPSRTQTLQEPIMPAISTSVQSLSPTTTTWSDRVMKPRDGCDRYSSISLPQPGFLVTWRHTRTPVLFSSASACSRPFRYPGLRRGGKSRGGGAVHRGQRGLQTRCPPSWTRSADARRGTLSSGAQTSPVVPTRSHTISSALNTKSSNGGEGVGRTDEVSRPDVEGVGCGKAVVLVQYHRADIWALLL